MMYPQYPASRVCNIRPLFQIRIFGYFSRQIRISGFYPDIFVQVRNQGIPGNRGSQNSRREFPGISEILAGITGNFASFAFYRAAWNATR